MAAPQGVSPNFEHPENNNDIARVSFAIMLVVSTLCVLLRVYGRVYLLKRMLVEDGMDNLIFCLQHPTFPVSSMLRRLMLTTTSYFSWQFLSCVLTYVLPLWHFCCISLINGSRDRETTGDAHGHRTP